LAEKFLLPHRTAKEDASARQWEKEAAENVVLSELNDAILSPRKTHPAAAEAQNDYADAYS
jgi:hypothetical protein